MLYLLYWVVNEPGQQRKDSAIKHVKLIGEDQMQGVRNTNRYFSYFIYTATTLASETMYRVSSGSK